MRTVIDSVERVLGRKVPHTIAPRRPGDSRVLYASSARIRKDLVIVATASRWREAHPHGYRRAAV